MVDHRNLYGKTVLLISPDYTSYTSLGLRVSAIPVQ